MKWVLNTYQTAQDWEVERIIEICSATGYEGVEFLQDFQQRHGLEASAPREHVLSVKEKMDGAGLIVSSLTSCCVFHSPEESERRRNVEQVRAVIDQAVLMGCDHVRVLGDRLPEEEAAREEVLLNVAAALRELGDYAAPHGVTVSLEAHGSFTDPLYATRVVREAGRENVGIVFNSQWRVGAPSGWSLPEGASSIAPLYDLMAPYLTSIHTHQMEQPELWRYYQEFFRLLVRDGYNGYVSNECAYRGPDPEKVLRFYTTLFHAFTS
ncbi:MAG TPA: sugar phosphate isomerase/epimerase family protein [Armatimonadota bacterium]|nr:sugar phosphate isomerase/epimerase family protein [Armatimonadota bacterium]